MAPHTINRAALVVIAPAVLVAGILSVTIIFTIVGLPLLALTLPTLVLALLGGVSAGPPSEVRPALPWLLGAFAVLLVGGVAVSAVFGGNDLDQPEEAVIGAVLAAWGVVAGVLAVRARAHAAAGRTGQPTANLSMT